uniref:RNase H type-1 domain-containing protein n=1 Tax=Chromera velia CCMP2878 TaxID=1169474 RepID=A0A0G4I7J9_9ALVE|eukprot:Cvel_11685.t1-p1 / transcript=Cvel_11685.t1 / gene=Cvel_11685 / organism=Chromera_velia_CCMP2878 / gene_product=hypothetical protein / transcript_product=hypothetical protein / location=Cvel_scaffold741:3452-4399(+) / protein_length=316 / sequence_SO=supercontig / SO=protein_coding / is_pseudo=false
MVRSLNWWKSKRPVRQLYVTPTGYLDVWEADWVASWKDIPRGVAMIRGDAAGTGGGGVWKGNPIWWRWSGKQAVCSSNWREAKTVLRCLQAFTKLGAGSENGRIVVRSDNSVTVRIINNRHNAAAALGDIVEEIQTIERKAMVEVMAVHIPGAENTEADSLSRMSGDVHRKEKVTDRVLRGLSHQATRALGREVSVVRGIKEKGVEGVEVHAPAGDEYQSVIKAATTALEPRILLVPRAVGDSWRRQGVKSRVMERFRVGHRLFEVLPPIACRVAHGGDRDGDWEFSIMRGQPIAEEWEAVLFWGNFRQPRRKSQC